MAKQRIIDGTHIGDTMREIQKREGRGGNLSPTDADTSYMIEMVPLHQAERRVVGIIKTVHEGRAFVCPGSICSLCRGDANCRCFGDAKPTHWGRLPEDWRIR